MVDPELAEIVPLLPAFDLADYASGRAMLAQAALGSPDAPPEAWREQVQVSDQRIPGPPNAPEVPVRIYRPKGDGICPGLVYLHGGAFVLGELGLFDPACGGYAADADLVVVSVDYRLAPEHPFPAGPDDCYAALEWTVANAGALAIDPTSIAVGGASAGGGLAAAVALMARDRSGPAIAFQLLLNPVLDDRLDTVSVQTFTTTPLWNSNDVAVMWDLYLGPDRRSVSPYAAPARAHDLSGLPPAYLLTSELDPLRDEGISYALRLLDAGVQVELHNVSGVFHAFDLFPAGISRAARSEQHAALRRALHKS
jgi:acetyl esterase/lipase